MVIFIIGLLASVVLVGLGTFRARGRDTRRITDLRSTQNALELFYAKNGEYPAGGSWDDLERVLSEAGIGVGNIPQDPNPGNDYLYSASTSRQSYVLGANIEDPDHSVLRDDVDGGGSGNYGVNCNDPVYCIRF